jgi:PAS domain S-box-containing protein
MEPGQTATGRATRNSKPALPAARPAGDAGPSGQAEAAAEALEIGLYCVEREGRCTFVNGSALATLGYARAEEVLGRNMHDLIHHTRAAGSPYPEAECPLLRTAATSGLGVRLANEVLWRRDGSFFVAEYSSAPIRRGGETVGSVVTFRDQADRADAEARLAVQHAVATVEGGPISGHLHAMRRRLQPLTVQRPDWL